MATDEHVLTAIHPEQHVAVSASAGTGKTYLLITRIIRLLLSGAAPGSILALTFTRKAAGEMRERLRNRLLELATCNKKTLNTALSSMGITASAENQRLAQGLHETVLFALYPIRITTFHAFCQNLLNRFPLEANIPPGFELLDSSSVVQDQAWDALFLEATRFPDSDLAKALETLFEACNTLHNTRAALLKGFLSHRSDWWAYTEGAVDPVAFAISQLTPLITNIPSEPAAAFLQDNQDKLQTFNLLLKQHPTQQNLQFADNLEKGINTTHFDTIKLIFLTAKHEIRKRELSKAMISNMGADHAEQFIELHKMLSVAVQHTHDALLSQQAFILNSAWYDAGQHVLDHYQRIKREQRLLDFADLEWKTYTLLRDPENALWVQYKLDQKINHLLIDEFQDTNPTQWQLLLPLLEEIASGEQNRKRSIFLVGDTKQSIYGFRRAKPELQITATAWLQNRLSAQCIPLSHSWRSSPAIIECLNRVFNQTALGEQLGGYPLHSTYKHTLWGHVEMLPLVQPEAKEPAPQKKEMRNPLLEAKRSWQPSLHYLEGSMIAEKIRTLIAAGYGVDSKSGLEKINYSHILILFRHRTHVAEYERAFTDANIPYHGAQRGGLLDQPEIRDLEALLRFLIAPFNNLMLAQILRSPLFAASDEDLIQLALTTDATDWFKRLQTLAKHGKASEPLIRAWQMLTHWSRLTGRLPLHDLLDRIYQEGDILARFRACVPLHQHTRVTANLNRFIEMALETDSGRYPSITHFLGRLNTLRSSEEDHPDMPSIQNQQQNRIRLMTIHAAKGLEAPIVFLADSCISAHQRQAYQPIVDWPASSDKPKHFLLSPPNDAQPYFFKDLHASLDKTRQKEEANLLYVALSRAQHMLFISGCSTSEHPASSSWYGQLHALLGSSLDKNSIYISHGTPVFAEPYTVNQPLERVSNFDKKLLEPLKKTPSRSTFISPSQMVGTEPSVPGEYPKPDANTARIRGLLIHDYLKLLNYGIEGTERLCSSYEYEASTELINDCRQEAMRVVQDASLQFIFSKAHYDKAYNEIPISYKKGNEIISGIIDRLIISGETAWIIDYKTHLIHGTDNAYDLAISHFPQIKLYAAGITKLNIAKTIRAGIVLTSGPRFYELDLKINET